ncbi:MAG: hypothetical protein R3E97_21955 [Candidatus Eisenbacteria bacterium]
MDEVHDEPVQLFRADDPERELQLGADLDDGVTRLEPEREVARERGLDLDARVVTRLSRGVHREHAVDVPAPGRDIGIGPHGVGRGVVRAQPDPARVRIAAEDSASSPPDLVGTEI